MTRSIVSASGVRTAIGNFGGALAGISPCDPGAAVTREALARAGVSGADIGRTVFGNVIHAAPEDMYLSRMAAMRASVAPLRRNRAKRHVRRGLLRSALLI